MVDRLLYTPIGSAAALVEMTGLRRAQESSEYTVEVVRVSDGSDLTDSVFKDPSSSVRWNSNAEVPASLQLTFDSSLALTWGSERVAVAQLIRSVEWNSKQGRDPSTWSRFPLVQFVLTSPGIEDLDRADLRPVTGYDLNYLLQNDLASALNFDYGTKYMDAVRLTFVAAGLLSSGATLDLICDFPRGSASTDWSNKTLPAPMPFPLDSGMTYLSVINELLKASGCSGLFTSSAGRWVIQNLTTYGTQPLLWRWYGSPVPGVADTELDTKIVLHGRSSYDGDVYNATNQWVFIQSGLDVQPIEGQGQYTVNNNSVPPSDQATVGRVLRKTTFLQASGMDDLKKQGDKIVSDQISQAERVRLATTPWPIAGQFDVFQVSHQSLPNQPLRRVVAQDWSLPLFGGEMEWNTNVVAAL